MKIIVQIEIIVQGQFKRSLYPHLYQGKWLICKVFSNCLYIGYVYGDHNCIDHKRGFNLIFGRWTVIFDKSFFINSSAFFPSKIPESNNASSGLVGFSGRPEALVFCRFLIQHRPNEFCFINLIGHGYDFSLVLHLAHTFVMPKATMIKIAKKRALNSIDLDLRQAHFQLAIFRTGLKPITSSYAFIMMS